MHSDEVLKKSKVSRSHNRPTPETSSQTEHPVLSMQRMIGNAAIRRLLQRENSGQESDEDIIGNANRNDNGTDAENEDANSADQNSENQPQRTFIQEITHLYRTFKTALEDHDEFLVKQCVFALTKRGLSPASDSLSVAGSVEGAFTAMFTKGGSLKAYKMLMQGQQLKQKVLKLVKEYEAVPWAYLIFSENNFLPSGQSINTFAKRRKDYKRGKQLRDQREQGGGLRHRNRL